MIRLTDEEIFEAVRYRAGDVGIEKFDRIAKAQLKKVVDIINEHIDTECEFSRFDVRCWQALLEEIK